MASTWGGVFAMPSSCVWRFSTSFPMPPSTSLSKLATTSSGTPEGANNLKCELAVPLPSGAVTLTVYWPGASIRTDVE